MSVGQYAIKIMSAVIFCNDYVDDDSITIGEVSICAATDTAHTKRS